MKKAFLHLSLTALLVFSGVTGLMLTSCAEVLSTILESDMQAGLDNAKMKSSATNQKKQAKEAERLKNDGKCPTCHGLGKTPDGRYTCSTCSGTGLYQSAK